MKAKRELSSEVLPINGGEHSNANWAMLAQNYILGEEFITAWANQLDWYLVCKYQALSEEFILRWIDRLNWYDVILYQDVSKTFMLTHMLELESSQCLDIIKAKYPIFYHHYHLELYRNLCR